MSRSARRSPLMRIGWITSALGILILMARPVLSFVTHKSPFHLIGVGRQKAVSRATLPTAVRCDMLTASRMSDKQERKFPCKVVYQEKGDCSSTKKNRQNDMYWLVGAIVSLCFAVQETLFVATPLAANAAATEDSRVVAEAWKVLDRAYVDPGFGGQDWRSVRREYVKPNYKNTKEAYQAIVDMCKKLGDKYTRFLTPAQYKTLQSMYTDQAPAAGIGVEIFSDTGTGAITIRSTVPESPSARAGLVEGDVILKVDQEDVREDMGGADAAAALLRGQQGTRVSLVVSSKGQSERVVQVVRETIKARPVTFQVRQYGGQQIGVIKIPTFAASTADDVLTAIETTKAQGAKAFVLDLRGNVGGSFPAGVNLAKAMLRSDQTVVYVVGRGGVNDEYQTSSDGKVSDVPVAVLVDGRTASAAEVFAAALQDNKRASLVGETTFGKGLVQTIAKLQDGSALVVTVAKYETPNHTDINKKGITPDVSIMCAADKDIECVPSQALTLMTP